MSTRSPSPKRIITAIILLILALVGYFEHDSQNKYSPKKDSSHESSTADIPDRSPFKGLVISVSDGDTVTVRKADGQHVRIRLYGIDCPELAQADGENARKFTGDLLYKKQVEIFPQDFDKYERNVAIIKIGERIANEEIVAAGWAWWYQFHARDYHTLKQLELAAKGKKLGLWKSSHPTPPWEWRKQHPRE